MSNADSIPAGAIPTTSRGWPAASAPAQPATSTSDRAWDPLLLCVAAYLLTAVGRVHELFPVLAVIRPALATGLLSIVLYGMDRRSARRWHWISRGPTPWLLGLAAWMVLSIPGALIPGQSFDHVIFGFSKTLVMALLLACAIRGPRDVERLAGIVFWAAALYSTVVIFRFDVGEGADWRLGKLYYYDANDFATFAVASMPIGVYLAQRARTWTGRALPILGLIMVSAAFVRSGSRGGFIALVVTSMFVVLTYRAVSMGKRLAAIAVVVLVVLAVASDRYWTQMSTIFSETDYNQTSESGRLQVWTRGVGYVLGHPLLGVGANNFTAAEGLLSPFAGRQQYGVGVRWSAPHNTFLQIAAELGLPGLLFFVAMFVTAFRALKRWPSRLVDERGRPPISPALKQALRASLIGFIVGSFFLSLAYAELLYTLIALAIGVSKVEWRFRRSLARA
jgi:O-antigen ligase